MTSTLWVNGPVFDGVRYRDDLAGVLAQDGRITALVGHGEELPSADEVVDLAGGLLTPGFTDAHIHAVQGGVERLRCDLSHLYDRDDYLTAITAYADANPDLPWILGGGWAMACFPGGTPLASDLDAIVPDRPVFLVNRDHHGAWANSCALELAGICAATPDPSDGYLERDEQGAPTGTLHEGAMALVGEHVPAATAEELLAGLEEAQRYLFSVGVTGWQDAIIGEYAGMTNPGPTYLAAARSGALIAEVVGALWWDRERGTEQVSDLIALREAYSHGRFRATSIKVMQDGVAENGTASMSTPYLDRCGHATQNTGHSFVDPGVLKTAAPLLAEAGFQLHIHAIGDSAVAEALDALEAVGPDARDLRHHLAHLQFVRPSDQERFGPLGVAVNAQTLWACLDDQMVDLTLPQVGPERAAWQYPFASMIAGGARMVSGSDWPVSTPDPWQALHVAVNRTDPEYGGEPLNPEQALSLEVALAAYTSGSAWINHRDQRGGAGVIAVGHTADLVAHDRDPFAADASEIARTTVTSTWVAGTQVFSL